MSSLQIFIFAAAAAGLTVARVSLADFIHIDPAGTYLHTNNDSPDAPTVVDLSALTFPVHDGDILQLQRVGLWAAGVGFPETATATIGVFSSSNTVLATSVLNRIPGALTAGNNFVTQPTFFGSQPTDIPQDFIIDSTAVSPPGFTTIDIQVPVGAHYLFLSAYDSNYQGNFDSNGDYGVQITPVPEPASLAVFGIGCASLLVRSSRRRQ